VTVKNAIKSAGQLEGIFPKGILFHLVNTRVGICPERVSLGRGWVYQV